jgi:hypothetical protein
MRLAAASTPEPVRAPWRAGAFALALLAGLALSGCFDAPKLEDRWTRVDITGGNVTAFQSMPLGASESLDVSTSVTYRAIVTGYAVADLRVAPGTATGSAEISPTASRQPMATAIDSLLAHSYTVGRATRAITGWDHLIQHIDFAFRGAVPDSLGPDDGLFLLVYLGSGDKVERLGQPDTIIVTPFRSADHEILPVGYTFHTTVAAP